MSRANDAATAGAALLGIVLHLMGRLLRRMRAPLCRCHRLPGPPLLGQLVAASLQATGLLQRAGRHRVGVAFRHAAGANTLDRCV